jgi:hypothetical protein
LILALLVLVKENRKWQAWLILVPFVLLNNILWPSIEGPFTWLCATLLAGSSAYALSCAASLRWLIAALAAIWLMSPWLARCQAIVGAILAVGVALSGGIATCALAYGFDSPGHIALVLYAAWVIALAVAFALSRLCCRRLFGRPRFLGWLLLWVVIVVGGLFGLCGAISLASSPGSLLLPTALPALPLAITVYLVNLPFMVLLFASPFYRDRFCRLLRLPVTPAAIIGPSSAMPLSESTCNEGTAAST